FLYFFFNDTATTEIYTLSLHDALPISAARTVQRHHLRKLPVMMGDQAAKMRSEEHTSELQSHVNIVCRLLLEKKEGGDPGVVARDAEAAALQREFRAMQPPVVNHNLVWIVFFFFNVAAPTEFSPFPHHAAFPI